MPVQADRAPLTFTVYLYHDSQRKGTHYSLTREEARERVKAEEAAGFRCIVRDSAGKLVYPKK